jgi:hypothetical protein
MTLVELERLIRRIEETLERPPADGLLPRLASDYNNMCRVAAQRLHQCAAMIAASDEHQALQLAEAAPALLDQLTLLAFRRSPNWRALCRSQNLPAPDNFDIKPVRQLNELYAKGIDKDHALYREYRRAVMVNDDARALAVLRSITRLNASDKNAATELARLEHKSRADKIHRLEKLIHDKAPAREISALAEELENVAEAQHSAAWIPAQTVRAAQLVEQARAARASLAVDDLQQILKKIPAVAHLLSPEDRSDVDELERWSAADAARRKEAASRRAAILELSATVDRIEHQQLAAHKPNLLELRRAADTLDRAWRQVEQFRAEIAGDIANRAQKLRDTLRLQIDRHIRASRRLGFAIILVVVGLCLFAARIAYERQSSFYYATRLHSLVAERRVREIQTALANARHKISTPALANARRDATEFMAHELNLKNAFDQRLAEIESHTRAHFTNDPPEQIAAKFNAAQAASAALAPEFRPAADAALSKAEAAWREFLGQKRVVASTRLSEILAPIESAADRDLQYSRDPSQVASAANSLLKQLDAARPLANPPLAELRPKQEALFRFESLETRINKFARDATNWSNAQHQLTAATNLSTYSAALQLLAANGFTPDQQRASVAALAALNLNDQALIAPLLLPNGPFSALAEPPRASRVPDEILPAEREIQRRLRDDENIQTVSRLEVEIKNLPTDNPRRHRTVFLRGELQSRITRRSGQIYDPVESPAALQFAQKEMSSLDYTVQQPTPTPERELFERAGLTRLIDSNTGKYSISLLQVLDEINRDRRASPLFRAWLFMNVCEMIDTQPNQWGAIWTPALAPDRAALERLGARQINSGDWFVPGANAQRAAALNAQFDRAAPHSYARQSAFYHRLLPKAAESGLRVIGYINATGEPVLNDTRAYNSIWTLTAPDQPPQMIFQSISPNQRPRPLTQGMPFAPLLVFAGNAADLINTSLQSLSLSAAAVNIPESLPPILRATP